MSDNKQIKEKTEYLFNCNFLSEDFDPENHEEHLACAEELLHTFMWKDIFAEWKKYLYENCMTSEKVINYCRLFSYYGGQDYFIPDPYEFVGYIYYMIDNDKYWDEAGEFIDGLCISILEKSGEISIVQNPYYKSWKDPNVLSVVERLKKEH